MSRFSLTVCVCLLVCGSSAKPFKQWQNVADEAFQETNVMMSKDIGGKMYYGVEVEAPEDMDVIGYDVDPNSAIWKSMTATGQEGYYQEAEVDDDDNSHPFSVEVKEPEVDWDMVYHGEEKLDQGLNLLMADAPQGRVHTKPEEDRDELDHPALASVLQVDPAPQESEAAQLEPEVKGQPGVRVHLQPEEDLDDLYHPDLAQPVSNDDADAPVLVELPADRPFERMHIQPEEDLDDLFHQ